MFNSVRGKTLSYYFRLLLPVLAIIFIIGTLVLHIAGNMLYPASAAGPGSVVFRGTLSPLVAHSHLVGPAYPNQRIALTIGLRPSNADGLTRYAQDISNPKSVNFHRYLTPAQITDVFGPTPAAHGAVLQFLRDSGFTITHTYNHRLLIGFSGTIGQIEQVFHITINTLTSSSGQSFREWRLLWRGGLEYSRGYGWWY